MKHSTGEVVISVKNVGVFYRRRSGFLRSEKFWALKDISFDLYRGETLGIIGRNGVGKSTLLRVLAGIITPDRGEIVRNNVTASLLSLQVGFVSHLTGRENAILSGMMLGLSKKRVSQRIDAIKNYADIGDFFDQPVRSYSAGMRARLGFAVAIHSDPDVILLDEVIGVGDAEFRKKSTQTMKGIVKSDKTIVLVSHAPGLIRELCDRVIWISNGKTERIGMPSEVLEACSAQ